VRESPQNNYFFLNQISRNEAVFILEQGTIDAVFCKNIALDMVSALIEKIFTFAPSDEHIELHSLYKNYLYSREQDTYRRLLSELSNPNIITMYLNEVIGKNGPAGRFSVEYLAKIKNISLYIWYRENENTSVISLCYACGVEDMRSCPHLLYTGDKGQYRLISCPPLNLLNRDSISPLDKQGINH
jgi:hypothetical protein